MRETGEKRRRLGGREATAAQIPGAYAISVGDTGAPLPQGWKRHLLSDLARMESGHTPSRRHPEYWGGSIPWIGIRDATGNHGRTIYETNENTNALGIANSASRVLPKDTVCLSRTASVGYVVVTGREMATSQDFANWICGPDLDYRYLKYALIAEGDALLNFASGSVHQTIYFPELKSFHIAAPEKLEQGAIADVLSALDGKIELNRRMNETLEGLAQAIFRDWFVDFGPTRRKAAGEANPVAIMGGLTPDPARAAELAALFPAAFDDDGLPVGWSETAIGDLVKAQGGSTPSTSDEALWAPAKHCWATPKDLSNMNDLALFDTARQISDAGLARITSGLLPVGSVLLSSRAPIGYLAIAQVPVAINQGFIGLAPTGEVGSAYLYCWCKANMEKIVANANGSTFQEISKKNFRPITSVLPADRRLIAEFGNVAEPLFARLIAGASENRTLAETRDYLLPRLMSGAVRVMPRTEAA